MDSLLNLLPCPTLITDESGRVLAINADLLTLVGNTAEHWLQQPMENFFPPASRIFLQTHVWPTLYRENAIREIYLKITNAQTHRVPVMLNCQKGEFKGTTCFIWVFFIALERSKFETELVAARQRAETAAAALRERERFVKNITDAMPGLVSYWDHNLQCRFANQTHWTWLKQQPETLINKSFLALMGETAYKQSQDTLHKVLAGNIQTFESTLTKADGTVCFYLIDLYS